tara:strand:- start:373 stop:1098 length:726 start_codon:yes stop_codon:yes gene_type:complete
MKENVHFIDCGANVGIVIDWAAKKYGKKLVKVDAFEPELKNYLTLLSKYSEKNHRMDGLCVHANAVWIRNEIKKFIVQFWGTRTGSSLMEDKEQSIKTEQFLPVEYLGNELDYRHADGKKFYRVDEQGNRRSLADLNLQYGGVGSIAQCIDLSEWIFKNVSEENYNVLKIDIEGAEYAVVKRLLDTGASELIDEWLVEFTPEAKVPESYDQEVVDRFMTTNLNYVDWDSEEAIEQWRQETL